MTLKQYEGNQIYNDNVAPKRGYNRAKFERSCCNGVQEMANVKELFFFSRGYLSIISIFNECSRQKGDIEMTLTYLTIL